LKGEEEYNAKSKEVMLIGKDGKRFNMMAINWLRLNPFRGGDK
jgi:hypothetical protein